MRSNSKPIIKTRWETDAYKLSMGMIFWLFFKHVFARYVFVDRLNLPYVPGLAERMREQVKMVATLPPHMDRAEFVKRKWPFILWRFLVWYANHQFNPDQVKIKVVDGRLSIVVEGPIYEVTHWEIMLLRIHSSLYTEMTGRTPKPGWREEAIAHSRFFFEHGVAYVEGGGRRPFSPEVHWDALTAYFTYPQIEKGKGGIMGTSFIEYAFQLEVMMFGTQAHEYGSFMGAFFGHENANEKALEYWVKVYGNQLGYVLPDTYTTEKFLEAFVRGYAILFSGGRQDSGDPYKFTNMFIGHYRSEGIEVDPTSKSIVYSNSLRNDDEILRLNEYKLGEYIRSFLFGGLITNNVGYDAYNTVLKLFAIWLVGEPEHLAVKLSDDPRKSVGDPQEIIVARQKVGIT